MGRHDFTQFANLMPTEEFRNPVRDVERCEVVETPNGFRIEVRRQFEMDYMSTASGMSLQKRCL